MANPHSTTPLSQLFTDPDVRAAFWRALPRRAEPQLEEPCIWAHCHRGAVITPAGSAQMPSRLLARGNRGKSGRRRPHGHCPSASPNFPRHRNLKFAQGSRLSETVTECTQSHHPMTRSGETHMCILCNQGRPQHPYFSRRNFLKSAAATGAAASAMSLFAPRPAGADDDLPHDSGRRGRRYIIRGGSMMSMDYSSGNYVGVGDFPEADVLVEGKKILAVGPNLRAGGAAVIDARGKIVMPGFIDTHHHQAWTAIRSAIPDSILINDGTGTASAEQNYFEQHSGWIDRDDWLRPPLPAAGRLRQRAIRRAFTARRRRHDGARHLADPPLAAALRCGHPALRDTGRRAMLGYFESAGNVRATSIRKMRSASSGDLVVRAILVGFIMGGEVYLGEPTYSAAWKIGRELKVQIAAHILSPFGIRPILDEPRRGHRRQRSTNDIGLRTRQSVHPHDRHVGQRLEQGQGRSAPTFRSHSRSR